ncbi:hypothetical protein GPECTOR_1g910 [Gonium pectorale]|uniref:TELO2 ARM repeat domain-containing protein n=1 Tax=Gonium pectorale TaxID=33097 RepID=A0A150H595_GONPE|nr:hypothetical protein GPECTOR_1g910 [Gonium pectorale]|eukprot:KXZ57008.1 hypothetical protein GPECTOR_1g910 [Gonium pectorale]
MDVASTVRNLVKEACRLVDGARSSDAVAAVLRTLHDALLCLDTGAALHTDGEVSMGHDAAWQQLRLYLDQLAEARQRSPRITALAARAAFFWLSFEPWAAALLIAAASLEGGGERPGRQRQRKQRQQQPQPPGLAAELPCRLGRIRALLAALFQLAPAPVVLRSLTSYLSLVSLAPGGPGPGPGGGSGASARVAARGAELAAALLAVRFAPEPTGDVSSGAGADHGRNRDPGGGVAELLVYLAWRDQPQRRAEDEGGSATALDAGSGRSGAAAGSSAAGSGVAAPSGLPLEDEAALRQLLLLPPLPEPGVAWLAAGDSVPDAAALAALLVSVPDRAAGLWDVGTGGGSPPSCSHPRAGPDEAWVSVTSACGPQLEAAPFCRGLLRQLLAALRDPAAVTAAALERLQRMQERCSGEAEAPAGGAAHSNGSRGPVEAGPPLGGSGDAGVFTAHAPPKEAEGAAAWAARSTRASPLTPESADGAGAVASAQCGRPLSDHGLSCLRRGVAGAAVRLLAELLERMAKRGLATVAADALLACAPSLAAGYGAYGGAGACSTSPTALSAADAGCEGRVREGIAGALAQLGDASPAAMERLLTAVLGRAAGAALVAMATAGCQPPAASPSGGPHGMTAAAAAKREQDLESLLGLPAPLPAPALAACAAALAWLLPPPLAAHPAVSFILTDGALLSLRRPPLPLASLAALVAALPLLYPAAQPLAAAAAAAAAWGDASAVTRTSVQRQAYLSAALLLLMLSGPGLDRADVERTQGLLGSLLGGVSARLGSPTPATARQAMRVGRCLARLLEPGGGSEGADLFGDMGELGLGPEELWPAGGDGNGSDGDGDDDGDTDGRVRDGAESGVCTETDSDDEEEVDGEDDLRPMGRPEELEGDAEADAWRRAEPSSLQLRSLAAALRKQDDVKTVLGALGRLEELIRAGPDELPLLAPELLRSLLHCRVPEWADEEDAGARGGAPRASAQRAACLVALLSMAPLPGGADLASRCLASLRDAAASSDPLAGPAPAPAPAVDLARTARILTSAAPPSLRGGSGAGAGFAAGAAGLLLVNDVSAW